MEQVYAQQYKKTGNRWDVWYSKFEIRLRINTSTLLYKYGSTAAAYCCCTSSKNSRKNLPRVSYCCESVPGRHESTIGGEPATMASSTSFNTAVRQYSPGTAVPGLLYDHVDDTRAWGRHSASDTRELQSHSYPVHPRSITQNRVRVQRFWRTQPRLPQSTNYTAPLRNYCVRTFISRFPKCTSRR